MPLTQTAGSLAQGLSCRQLPSSRSIVGHPLRVQSSDSPRLSTLASDKSAISVPGQLLSASLSALPCSAGRLRQDAPGSSRDCVPRVAFGWRASAVGVCPWTGLGSLPAGIPGLQAARSRGVAGLLTARAVLFLRVRSAPLYTKRPRLPDLKGQGALVVLFSPAIGFGPLQDRLVDSGRIACRGDPLQGRPILKESGELLQR